MLSVIGPFAAVGKRMRYECEFNLTLSKRVPNADDMSPF